MQNFNSMNWIIDSGATNHIATSVTCKMSPPMTSQVSLPNGSHAKITSIESAHLSNNLYVKDVLCVPSFYVNLLSISQLTSTLNCSIHFFSTFCVL